MKKLSHDCGLLCKIAVVLTEFVRNARGHVLTFSPSEVAKVAQISPYIVGQVFRKLAEVGYMECRRENKRLCCSLTRNSPLWTVDPQKIIQILEALTE